MKAEDTALFLTQGSSDKVYQAHLQPQADGWEVTFEYGRRGKPLRTGTKTAAPVPYETAKKVYDRLVLSKTAKGYTPSSTGVAFTSTEQAGMQTTFLPQLLNQVNQQEAEQVYRDAPKGSIYLQIKHDGERRGIMAHKEVIAANRKGLVCQLQEDVHNAIQRFTRPQIHPMTFDTEDMGDHLIIFDILRSGGADQRAKSFSKRAQLLRGLHSLLQKHSARGQLRVDLPLVPGSMSDFRYFIDAARNANEEGVVIRHGNAKYTPGRPNSGGGCLKLKFVEDATVMVHTRHPSKRSIGIAVFDGSRVVPVGNCTVPTNYDIPNPGDIVSVKYLYAYPQGSLFQPVYKGLRLDQSAVDCHISQLKYKKGT